MKGFQRYAAHSVLLFALAKAEDWTLVPKWQTVVPDTGIMVPLTGSSSAPSWQLFSDDGVFMVDNPRLPSDVLTNLLDAGIIGDPYYDRNFLTERYVWMGDHAKDDQIYTNRTRVWVYTTTFELPTIPEEKLASEISWKLIVEGIKMGAHIALNGIHLGTVNNQFLRYEFDVSLQHMALGNTLRDTTGTLKQGHTLSVTFDPFIKVDGRFTACSGGWDWAPYTRSHDEQGRRSYTFGIIKPIYLVAVENLFIRHLVPKIYYQGPYPKEPMLRAEGDFKLEIYIHLGVTPGPKAVNQDSMKLTVSTGEETHTLPVVFHPLQESLHDEVIVNTTIMFHPADVELWWPNGMGDQPLYDIKVGFHHPRQDEAVAALSPVIQKRIAFRTVALVTIDESNETEFHRALAGESEGSGSHGMYFRVNGALLVARGANFIPMDQLEGRQLDEAHRIAVKSAAEANMNMLRVWGGGMVLPDAFYDACDEYGVLLYHDMMFVDEAGHGPVKTPSVESEIRHFVRSLASHPSIVVWNGCNECQVVMGTPSEIYASFVMSTVAEEDDTRSIWPSSPSKHGWKTGVHTLDSRPNGNRLSTWKPDDFKRDIETHGPYMRSSSLDYPGVNRICGGIPYQNTPPTFSHEPIGISMINNFASEFGASVYSSAESMSGTISPSHWSVHGNSSPDQCKLDIGCTNSCLGTNIMAERNYPCDSHIQAYFGNSTSLDAVGETAFQEQMFHCIMAQTLWMKGEVETRRSKNSYGLLIWQLNENWPTGGWGCIEYGPSNQNESQVMGGRWKPLMHLLEASLFRDIMAACGKNNDCYIRNDGGKILSGTISFEAWRLGAPAPSDSFTQQVLLASNSIHRLSLPGNFTRNTDVVIIQVNDNQVEGQLLESIFLSKQPKDIPGLTGPVSINTTIDAYDDRAEIKMTSNKLALFVVLTCRAQGRFSENAVVLRPGEAKTVVFRPMTDMGKVDVAVLRRTLRVEHLGFYLAQSHDHLINQDASVEKTLS